jgi:hypothetical protein
VALWLHYLWRKLVDVLTAFEENEQPMMPIENIPFGRTFSEPGWPGSNENLIASEACGERLRALPVSWLRPSEGMRGAAFRRIPFFPLALGGSSRYAGALEQ